MSDPSQKSMKEASASRVKYSGHGKAIGAAGYHDAADAEANKDPLLVSTRGESVVVDPSKEEFHDIKIGLSWENLIVEQAEGLLDRLLRRTKKAIAQAGVDLDLGCLYELQNGERGCLQPFGEMFGSLEEEPWIAISGDERTGNTEGADEMIVIKGDKWPEIRRVLVYPP